MATDIDTTTQPITTEELKAIAGRACARAKVRLIDVLFDRTARFWVLIWDGDLKGRYGAIPFEVQRIGDVWQQIVEDGLRDAIADEIRKALS